MKRKKKTSPISATKIAGNGAALSIPTPTSGEYSLYYHIPFCTKKCPYCHFFVLPDRETDKDLLLEGFKQELSLRAPSGTLISQYFGGGTPSLFGPERIHELILPCDEITLEANPENLNLDLLRAYRQAGVNRLSIGVQSFDADHLIQLGRTHTASKAEKALEMAFAAGFSNISLDLMYDLPHQTLASWIQTLKKAVSLPVTHISLYNLTIETGTAFFKQGIKEMPNPKLSEYMYTSAQNVLQDAGFKQYEISAFAKENAYSRHNTGYWLGRPFYGLGPSAFSYWNQKRFRNVAHLKKYMAALKKGAFPVDFEESLGKDARERELFAIQLRLLQGTPLPSFVEELTPFVEQGLLQIDERVKLTPKGILVYDTIASEVI